MKRCVFYLAVSGALFMAIAPAACVQLAIHVGILVPKVVKS